MGLSRAKSVIKQKIILFGLPIFGRAFSETSSEAFTIKSWRNCYCHMLMDVLWIFDGIIMMEVFRK